MTKAEAAQIIDAIRQSVEHDPSQFHLTLEVANTGFQSTAHGGGIGGLSAVGGGPGSSTVGVHASASAGDVQAQLVHKRANQVVHAEFQMLVDALNAISAELRAMHPDQSKLTRLCDSIKRTWVPGVICGVLGNLITLTMTTAS